MPVCFSIFNLRGNNNNYNTILYREPILKKENEEPKCVIFFPGDYSNFFTNSLYTSFKIKKRFECTIYCYSYEVLFWVLSYKYLYDHIIFIKPKIFENYFVCFSNFIKPNNNVRNGGSDKSVENESNDEKINKEDEEDKAVPHLLNLLDSLKEQLDEHYQGNKSYMDKSEKNISFNITKNDSKIILIGFSKGCSVLIALLNETKDKYLSFWKKIHSVFFLDPGFNKPTFHFHINNQSLKKIYNYNLKIIVHSTLRQIYDECNNCIHKRVYEFFTMLKRWNITFSFYLHYEYVKKSITSINYHFEILTDFFEEINHHPYSVILLNLDTTNKDGKNSFVETKYNKKKKEHFLFESWCQ